MFLLGAFEPSVSADVDGNKANAETRRNVERRNGSLMLIAMFSLGVFKGFEMIFMDYEKDSLWYK